MNKEADEAGVDMVNISHECLWFWSLISACEERPAWADYGPITVIVTDQYWRFNVTLCYDYCTFDKDSSE